MRSCSNCKRKNRCVKVCPEVESRLPKDYTGRDPKVEVCMAPEDLGVVVDMYSYALWAWAETASRRPAPDLSRLTPKEKNALMLIAQGMSMRGAAKRLGINLNALQCRAPLPASGHRVACCALYSVT